MTPILVVLLFLLLFSLVFNIIQLTSKPNKDIIQNLNKSINILIEKLGNSTSNLNKIIQDNSNLKQQVTVLEKEREDLLRIGVGNRVLLPYSLVYKESNHSFNILYDADVIEVSLDRLKISVTDYTSNDSEANKKSNRQGIINFMQNKWVNRSSCELITDEVFNRDTKIEELLK
jgi:hypothetical protein